MSGNEIDVSLGLMRAMSIQQSKDEVHELCRLHGAAFVIDAARAYLDLKARQAESAHKRWQAEMRAAGGAGEKG